MAAEGVVFHPSYISPSFFRTRAYPHKGVHGYLPESPSSNGVFAYRGSRLAGGTPDPVPAVKVFDIVTRIVAGTEPARL